MPTLIDPALMRQIIMSHYEKPRNKRTVTDPRYIKIHMNSELYRRYSCFLTC